MDDTKQILYDFQIKRFKAFNAQDPENEDFDVAFDFNGNKLYATKIILTSVSPTFKSMLSKRWIKENESIKIEGYSFDDYKEFLTFIYSGQCELTNDNIFSMVDLAEFYGITVFKGICEKFLTKILCLENVFQISKLSDKYSMTDLKKYVDEFFSKNFSNIVKSKEFQKLPKSTVKSFVETNQKVLFQEEMFEAVYKWAENQSIEKQKLDNTLDIDAIINEELSDLLPFFKFESMNAEFFIKFVVKKSFLSRDELSDILLSFYNIIYVKVINEHGKIAKGKLKRGDDDNVVNVINTKKNIYCNGANSTYCFWDTKQPKPLTPSKVFKNENVDWYLIYDKDGDVAVKNRTELFEKDYLLAEMNAENGFHLNKKCKIEVYRAF